MMKSREPESQRRGLLSKLDFSIAEALSAVLSVTFLVLAVYIAIFSASVRTPKEATDLRYFAAIVGSYGIWRMVRIFIKKGAENS
jgi:membrane protein DedA with SNARE-associated domain